jgi:hypothetical protein
MALLDRLETKHKVPRLVLTDARLGAVLGMTRF